MEKCYEEGTCFITVGGYHCLKENRVTLGKCCLYQDFFDFDVKRLLEADNVVKVIEGTLHIVKEIKNFTPGNCACCGKSECSFKDFKLDTIKINVRGCNLKCAMCGSYQDKPFANDHDLYFKLLEKFKGHKLKQLILSCVGEPFLLKEKTMNYLKTLTQNDFQEVLIITNGTLIDEEDIKELSQLSVKVIAIVSNDAITKETYDKIRIGGNFEKVMKNIICFKKYNMLQHVNVVIQPLNIHEVPFIEDFWKKYDVDVHFVMVRATVEHNYEEFRKSLKNTNDKELKSFLESHAGKIE